MEKKSYIKPTFKVRQMELSDSMLAAQSINTAKPYTPGSDTEHWSRENTILDNEDDVPADNSFNAWD